jgi:hypothetical protein
MRRQSRVSVDDGFRIAFERVDTEIGASIGTIESAVSEWDHYCRTAFRLRCPSWSKPEGIRLQLGSLHKLISVWQRMQRSMLT